MAPHIIATAFLAKIVPLKDFNEIQIGNFQANYIVIDG